MSDFQKWLERKVRRQKFFAEKHPDNQYVVATYKARLEILQEFVMEPRREEFMKLAGDFPAPKALFRLAKLEMIEDFEPWIAKCAEIYRRAEPFHPFAPIAVVHLLHELDLEEITDEFMQVVKETHPCMFKANVVEGFQVER